ncbi:MAG TPA: TlpA disulfide reductase family protein [Actinomycetota bacterium]|nr:TlpA disulfide reductase family protein [Actinomycetota bacterium]
MPSTITPRTRRVLRLLAFAVVPGLFIVVLAVGLVRTTTPHALQNTPAPAFTAQQIIGGGSLSSADLAGTPVVINFWASWCAPCMEEAPTMEAMYKRFQAQGVKFIGIDYEDIDLDATIFERDNGITYPSLRDPQGTLASKFGVRGVPETFFIDSRYRFYAIGQGDPEGTRNGTKIVGPITPQEMVSQITAMLAVQPSPAPSGTPSPSPSGAGAG